MAKSNGKTTVIYSKQFNDFKIVSLRTVKNKKYKSWFSVDKYNYLINSVNNIKDEIQLYKLREDIHFLPYLPIRKSYLNNTLEAFNYYSNEQGYKLPYIDKIISDLKDIITKDVPFKLNGDIYLYHTYKILGLIRDSFLAYELSNNKEFKKNTIARFKRSKQSFQQNQKRQRKLYLQHKKKNKNAKVKSKSTYLLHSFMYRTLNYRDKYLKIFMGYFAMMGIDNIKILNNNDYESNKLKKALNLFMSAQVTKEDCANSLSSVLYFYLHFKMRFKKTNALQYTKYLVDKIYGISNNYTGSELLKNIHISEVVGSHIVFGFSTKTKIISEHQKDYLENTLLSALEDVHINKDKFAIDQIRPIINNPLISYVLMTPMELLEKY
ncbi:hypothetical protein [Sulfurimonas sp. CS5]|uniref:hypothetical protein n=1 Tax=Sulfurimonas sp. CS5 TaxID=3391145 RepID=UPI0039E7998F